MKIMKQIIKFQTAVEALVFQFYSLTGKLTINFLILYSFTLVVSMIFLNLFIAIILESFENVNKEEDLKIKDSDLKVF
jgi:uncharacterized membrane protein